LTIWGTPADEVNLSEAQKRELICEIGRRCWEKNYVEANGGNISCRLENNLVLASPTFISKGHMEPEDLVVVDLDGNQVSGFRKKTSEILVHLTIYKHKPEAMAVVHTHPSAATAFAITGSPVPKCILPEAEVLVGEIPMTKYHTPGTQQLADQIISLLPDFWAFLLANHGLVCAGTGLIMAYWRTEIIEKYCQTLLLAKPLGNLTPVGSSFMHDLLKIKETMGIHDRRLTDPHAARCDIPPPMPDESKEQVIQDIVEKVLKEIQGNQ
jgi:L-fuculose-phosphate aldolase